MELGEGEKDIKNLRTVVYLQSWKLLISKYFYSLGPGLGMSWNSYFSKLEISFHSDAWKDPGPE